MSVYKIQRLTALSIVVFLVIIDKEAVGQRKIRKRSHPKLDQIPPSHAAEHDSVGQVQQPKLHEAYSAICAVAKNENRYIHEWVKYHRCLGEQCVSGDMVVAWL